MRPMISDHPSFEGSGDRDGSGFSLLTDKQREVLDYLIQHKTSKEISRILGISPHTVDQRISLARAKLGVSTRNEVAQSYRRMLDEASSIYERATYEDSHIARPFIALDTAPRDDIANYVTRLTPEWMENHLPGADEDRKQVVPELLDGKMGTVNRLAASLVLAFLLMALMLSGLSMFMSMSDILMR